MNKGLEALKVIRGNIEADIIVLPDETECCDIIETELKRLEKQDEILRIIKEKEVDVGWLKRAKDLHEYNSGMGIGSYSALTQKEYDLLKEWLK